MSERLRGLQVDQQLELGRLLDGKVRRFGTLQNLVHVFRRVAEDRGEVSCVTEQSTRNHVFAQSIRHRQPRGLQQLLQLGALGKVHAVPDHHDGLRSLSNDLSDGGAELRRRAGDNPERNEVQRGAGALGTGPGHGM